MRPELKESFSFIFSPKGVKHEVEGEELTFYPITLGKLKEIKETASSLAQAIASIMFQDKVSETLSSSTYKEDKKTGSFENDTQQEASIAILEHKDKERKSAIHNIITILLDESNFTILGDLLVHSLRDKFPADMKKGEILEFVQVTPLPALKDMVIGIVKANMKALGPLAERIVQLQGEIMGGLETIAKNVKEKAQNN